MAKSKARDKKKPARKPTSGKAAVIARKTADRSSKRRGLEGTDPQRVAAILSKLNEAYPNATCELRHDNPFQLLIATILSAQCTDVRVNQVTETLFKKYPTP
jgi:endonuclease-3